MKFEIAISLTLFNVIHLLCLVVLISELQMLVKQGRWSQMLLIITPDEVLMLCISSCFLGVLFDREEYSYKWQILLELLHEGGNHWSTCYHQNTAK